MFHNSRSFSVLVSVVAHLIFLVPALLIFTRPNMQGPAVIEVGFGNGEAGGGGGGAPKISQPSVEEKIPVKSKETKVKKTEEKKPVQEEKKKEESTSNNTQGSTTGSGTGTGGGNGTGTGTGSGSGTGPGTGGGLGIPIPKKVVNEAYLVGVEQEPEPYGGLESIESKLPSNLKGTGKGTVYVLAYIDELGVVRKVLLSKGVGNPYDDAALNAVKRTRFKAGRQHGENVRVQMHIALTF
jgi:protein TonB